MRISVVVATRNREAHATACIASILANTSLSELLVIDQSDGTATESALSAIEDARLHYVRTETRGVTTARNLGVVLSGGEVVAFTDDDCRVAPDWTQAMEAIFEADPEVAVVCGRVRVPEDIAHLGFTESFEPRVREWKGHYPPFGSDWGITANLALRRDVVNRVGYFDPMLGAGAPLRSGGEPDFLFRVLRAGLKVINAKEVVVDHLGVRAPGAESRKLMRGYAVGTGAAIYKHVRLGDTVALRLYVQFIGANAVRVLTNLVHGRGLLGLGYLLGFVWGSVRSYQFRVDRISRQYARR